MVSSPAELGPPAVAAVTLTAGDGLLLAADVAAGAGPGLLLAHGFGQTRQAWSATQRRLAAAGRASLAWDVRGHGGSERNPLERRYSGEQFVADVIVAAKSFAPEGAPTGLPVLVGASMGGLTGLMAQALARPFSALVLVDITPRWEASGVERILGFMSAHPDGFASYEDAAEQISAYLPHRRARKTPAQLAHLLQPRADGRLVWHWDPRLLAEFIPDTNGLQDRLDAACRALDVPVLLVSGGRSDLVTAPTIEHFLELAPHARHVPLPDATHMVAGDDNDAFTDALLSFLSDLPAVPTAAPGDSR
jgi:pimeloyl-ACP methyl ester carboxylesterase